jgi:predicted DsbA family dithiol-disulfide isomerase
MSVVACIVALRRQSPDLGDALSSPSERSAIPDDSESLAKPCGNRPHALKRRIYRIQSVRRAALLEHEVPMSAPMVGVRVGDRVPPVWSARVAVIQSQKLDIVCSWCYVGKRRLDTALTILQSEGLSFDVRWRPFQLNPCMPQLGLDRREYRSAKFGSWAKSQLFDKEVAVVGAQAGLEVHHERMSRTPSTVASHILIGLAYTVGGAALQGSVVENLFAAYFSSGRDIGDKEVLAEIGANAGLAPGPVRLALDDPEWEKAVLADEAWVRQLNLDGVPLDRS